MKTLRKLIRIAILLFVLQLIYYSIFPGPDEKDARISISNYAKQCQTTIDKATEIASIQASIEASKILDSGKNSLSDTFNVLRFQMEQSFGLDSEKRIKRVTIKAVINTLENDSEKCQLLKNSEAKSTPATKANKTPTSESTTNPENNKQENSKIVSQEVKKQTSVEYSAKLDAIRKDPEKFINSCTTEGVTIAMKFGGMSLSEAEKKYKANCFLQLDALKRCMEKPSAKADFCYMEVFETGD